MQGAVFVRICLCWPKIQTNKENKIKPRWKLKGGQKPQNFVIQGSTHHGLLACFCVLYSSIHVKEIIDISWFNGQNLNTFVKVLDPRFIKVKSIITDIKWCWWHLEILLLISNWLVSHRSPTAVFSNTFHTPEAPSRLCWPQRHLIRTYLHSNSATKRQFHGPSSPSLHRHRCTLFPFEDEDLLHL